MAKRKMLFSCLLAFVLLLQGPSLLQSWSANLQTLKAIHFCLSSSEEITAAPEIRSDPWLQAIIVKCAGDTTVNQAALKKALAIAPSYIELVRTQAPENLTLARSAVEHYPTEPIALFWLADLLAEQEDTDDAIDAYERGLVGDEQNGLMWVRLGRQYEEKGDWETAVQAFDKGCHYVDQGKNGCPAAGRLYLAHNQYELAAQRYRDSLLQLPGYAPAKRGLVEALLALGRTDEALPYLRELAADGDADAQQKLDDLQLTP
jgi:predicted Zn-dependent protease